MDYKLTTPCQRCPFRSDIAPFISTARCQEILRSGAEFACHTTCDYSKRSGGEVVEDTTQHCVGVLIILERENRPHQMMRISERLGFYNRLELRMDAPVYKTSAEALRAHEKQDRMMTRSPFHRGKVKDRRS